VRPPFRLDTGRGQIADQVGERPHARGLATGHRAAEAHDLDHAELGDTLPRAGQRGEGVRFGAEPQCAALPFADGAFDLVVSFETIEHIRPQREFLAEVRRVLAPEGMLLISSPNKAEYTDRPITNWLFCGAGMIPIRRQNSCSI